MACVSHSTSRIGMPVKRGDFPYEDWLAFITDTICRHEAEDKVVREKAAAELNQLLNDRELLFGSQRTGFVSLPGSSRTWRSGTE
jgi:hypothetical protein